MVKTFFKKMVLVFSTVELFGLKTCNFDPIVAANGDFQMGHGHPQAG